MPDWTPGWLELHHIATGRGNATFIIAPDGTTMMVDCGAIYGQNDYVISPRPNASRRPGEWCAMYVTDRLKAARLQRLDYLLLTHFHPDHIGAVASETPIHPNGFALTGVSDLAAAVEIGVIVDRAFPTYNFPSDLTDPHQTNYRKFIFLRVSQGKPVKRFVVGSASQFSLVHDPDQYPNFEVRNLAGNGFVWTGAGEQSREAFQAQHSTEWTPVLTENMCSTAVRITYGAFQYYTGGDLSYDTETPGSGWADLETPVASTCGPVTVAVANHHGYVDAVGKEFTRLLDPSVFVVFSWDSAHPTIRPLEHMLGGRPEHPARMVLSTAMKPENRICTRRTRDMLSQDGSIIIRCHPSGQRYDIAVLDPNSVTGRVAAMYGPYSVHRRDGRDS